MKKSFLASAAICFSLVLAACGPSTKDVPAGDNIPTSDIVSAEDLLNNSGDKSVTNDTNNKSDKSEAPLKQDDSSIKTDSSDKAHGNNLFDYHGKLSLDGTRLVDCHGDAFQLKGVSTHGIAWFPQFVNRDSFASLRDDWGVNCIRLAMYTDEGSGYCTSGDKEALKALVKDGVQYATELDMYVIIDWHVLAERDPNTYKAEAIEFFSEMSKLYADYDNVLYEICNEPNGSTDWSTIKKYAQDVIPVIKASNEDAVIIVGTPTWSQDVDVAAKDPITGYSNIFYTIHFYANTHRQDLRNKVLSALDSNLPIFCSEFGICDASGNGGINEAEADKWIQLFDDEGISYCIWNLSNKNESSALIKPGCIKTSGWSYDDLSQEGQWYVNTLGRKASALNDSNHSSSNNSAVSETQGNSGNLAVAANASNSWIDDTYEFCQYSLTISNNDNTADAIGWTVLIEFDSEIELDQSWNGTYKLSSDSKSLIITPVDYNSTIAKGSTYSDIGFIIKSNKTAKITKVSIN